MLKKALSAPTFNTLWPMSHPFLCAFFPSFQWICLQNIPLSFLKTNTAFITLHISHKHKDPDFSKNHSCWLMDDVYWWMLVAIEWSSSTACGHIHLEIIHLKAFQVCYNNALKPVNLQSSNTGHPIAQDVHLKLYTPLSLYLFLLGPSRYRGATRTDLNHSRPDVLLFAVFFHASLNTVSQTRHKTSRH